MSAHPEVSVVVGTYNGSKKIPCLLKGLLKQTFQNFELIIVIDGSTDNTIQVLDNFRSFFKHFKILVQSNQGRSCVRNRGVREASTNIIIFYDDDMIPFEDSIQRHITFHQEHRGILGGNPIEEQASDKTDIQNYKSHLTKVWTKKYVNGITQLNFSNLFFSAANASMHKETFNTLNGFDTTLTDAEDQDLAFRALFKGIAIFFDKENKAIHREFITCVGYIKRLRLYANAHMHLTIKYPERYDPPQRKIHFIKSAIYRIFAFPFWANLIEKGFFKNVLPRRIRYKLYAIIIQSLAVEYPSVRL